MPAGRTATGSGHGKYIWAALAAETGLEITECQYPPGTSKWNRIVLYTGFRVITMTWRGRPLETLGTVIELISSTITETGLSIQAGHDPKWYPTGIKITDAELAAVPLEPHEITANATTKSPVNQAEV